MNDRITDAELQDLDQQAERTVPYQYRHADGVVEMRESETVIITCQTLKKLIAEIRLLRASVGVPSPLKGTTTL